MGVRLPAEYQEVSFLQSTGTQYIALSDGGDIDGAECSFQYTEANNLDAIYGSSDNTSQNTKRFFSNIYNNSIQVSSGINETSIQFSTDLLQFHSLRAGVFCGNKAILDGTERDMLPAITRDYNMGVFCMCTNTGYGRQSKARIFALTFYVGNTIKYKLICCYRKADNKPGMYDLVSDTFFVNRGTGEFLIGPDVIDSISPLMVAWRRIMMAAASVAKKLVKLIATATSGLVSFTTNVIRPIKVTCEFSPVQEGTGDPSPDNVRPISGWTGCEIGHTGKNLFDGTVTNARIQNGVVVATGSYRLSEYIRVKPDTSYALVNKDGNLSQIFAHFFDENKTFLQSITTTDGIVVSPAGASYMRFHVTSRVFGDQKPFMLFEGSTATAYEPYQGATLPITFTDPTTGDPMTVYGGTVTLNEDGSADLAGTRLSIEFDGSADEVWSFEKTANGYKNAYIAMPSTFKTSQISSTEMICSASPTNATKIGITYRAVKDACYISNGRNFNFCWLDTLEISSANDFKAWLQDGHSLQVVATLIYPITYHFDNIGQLQSFLGQNNIWHNMNGDITVEYWKKQ